MNPFTQHTQQQGVTYIEHLLFAAGIAWRLLNSVFAFAVHAIFPFIDIDKTLDLEATANYLQERNHWIEHAKLHEQKNSTMMVDTKNHAVSH
ncbi:MAG: DUF6356 family protein [Gammaproteobacteria bacterium]|nr:DUF6356 family protein [Gammaproteobacteria bacterium]